MKKKSNQTITKPSTINSNEIVQTFSRVFDKYNKIEIYSGAPRTPDFERLTISGNGSPVWLKILVEHTRQIRSGRNGKESWRTTSESITIDRKQAEQLIENLKVLLETDLQYHDKFLSAKL